MLRATVLEPHRAFERRRRRGVREDQLADILEAVAEVVPGAPQRLVVLGVPVRHGCSLLRAQRVRTYSSISPWICSMSSVGTAWLIGRMRPYSMTRSAFG